MSQPLSLLNLLQLLVLVAYEYNVVLIQQEFAIVSEKVSPLKMVSSTTTLIKAQARSSMMVHQSLMIRLGIADRLWTVLKKVGNSLGGLREPSDRIVREKG